MNSKDFLLASINAEVEYKSKACQTLREVRSYIDDLPEDHPIFQIINREQSTKQQAKEIMNFLRLLERYSLNPNNITPREFVLSLQEEETISFIKS